MLQKAAQRGLKIVIVLAAAASLGLCQTSPTVKQDAKDTTCSNIVALSGNVSINCSALTPAQRKLIESIPAMLNKILAQQLDPDAVMAKLDEIQRGLTDLRDASAPRRISDSDAARLRALLAPFKGQKVSLAFMATDNETARLAQQLQDILRAAQWDTETGMSSMTVFAHGPLNGVELTVREATPAANAILNALHAVLTDVAGHLDPNLKDDTISIVVYSKR
jgi:hypothetical protein